MKILVVSDCPTHPTTAGNRKLILEYCRMLQGLGHEIHFLFIPAMPFSSSGRILLKECINETKRYWQDNYHEFRRTLLGDFFKNLTSRIRCVISNGYAKCDDNFPRGLINYVNNINETYHFDACIVNYMWNSKLLMHINIPKKALFTHDHFSYKDILVGHPAWQACKANEEAKAMQRAPYIFAMQEEEAAFFQFLSPKSTVLINYATFEFHQTRVTHNHNILFLSGPNEYNINGLNWFVNKVFPEILEVFSDAKLLVGGAICDQLKNYSLNKNIELCGIIDNEMDFYSKGDIFINPTYEGTGLKIKTFEAISYSKVVIVHPHSTIGIFKKEKAPLFASLEPADWGRYLSEVWNDIDIIGKYKKQDERYITDVNSYIEDQFKIFLKD